MKNSLFSIILNQTIILILLFIPMCTYSYSNTKAMNDLNNGLKFLTKEKVKK